VTGPGLRLGPSLAGALVAAGVGLLAFGYCAASAPHNAALEYWSILLGWWVFAAACLYAANQAWNVQAPAPRLRLFALCLAIAAVPLLPLVLFTVSVMILEALGGHL